MSDLSEAAALFDEGVRARTRYGGRADLSALPTPRRTLLELIRDSLNGALANQRADDPTRRPDERFYFDYMDGVVPAGNAFLYCGYAFVGMTLPLMGQFEAAATAAAQSVDVASAIGFAAVAESTLATMLVVLTASFAVGHEYCHHLFGDTGHLSGAVAFGEFDRFGEGDLTKQAVELNADGYSTFLALNNLVLAEGRPHWTSILAIGDREEAEVDQMLIAVWVCGMTAYFASVPRLRGKPFRQRSHPPMTVRLRCALEHARQWAAHNRPHLKDWLPQRFAVLHRATIIAVCGATELAAWLDEVEQMKSPEGQRYNRDLDVALDGLKARLTPRQSSASD